MSGAPGESADARRRDRDFSRAGSAAHSCAAPTPRAAAAPAITARLLNRPASRCRTFLFKRRPEGASRLELAARRARGRRLPDRAQRQNRSRLGPGTPGVQNRPIAARPRAFPRRAFPDIFRVPVCRLSRLRRLSVACAVCLAKEARCSSAIPFAGSPVVAYVAEVLHQVRAKNPAEPEFHQAVEEVLESLDLVIVAPARIPEGAHPRAHRRARARAHVPRAVAGRSRRRAGQPRLPHRDEQRDRPLQGRPALPSVGEPRHPEVPGVRAGVQELADDAADGRRQGRLGLRSARARATTR